MPPCLPTFRPISPNPHSEITGQTAASLNLEGTGFYLDRGKWAAINPDQRKEASVKFTAPAANDRYRVSLHAVGENDGNSAYCFAQSGELYFVYLPQGGAATLDLTTAAGEFTLAWFNPREGGALKSGAKVRGGTKAALTAPTTDDWLAVVRR